MFKLVLEKAEEPVIKLPTSAGSSKKAREFQKNIYFCFIDYAKAFDCVDHNKLWKILREMGIPEWSSGFPYFLQFKSEFGNKEFMIWASQLPVLFLLTV